MSKRVAALAKSRAEKLSSPEHTEEEIHVPTNAHATRRSRTLSERCVDPRPHLSDIFQQRHSGLAVSCEAKLHSPWGDARSVSPQQNIELVLRERVVLGGYEPPVDLEE
jgi:hypothetical protein